MSAPSAAIESGVLTLSREADALGNYALFNVEGEAPMSGAVITFAYFPGCVGVDHCPDDGVRRISMGEVTEVAMKLCDKWREGAHEHGFWPYVGAGFHAEIQWREGDYPAPEPLGTVVVSEGRIAI